MHKKHYYAALAYLLVPLAGMSSDIYLPSLPSMVRAFSTTSTYVQLTITGFVLAMGLGQMLAGPVSDAYGRKKQIIFALLVQLCCIIVIIYGFSIYEILVARFFQGLGAAFMIVPARAILNDVFSGDQLKKHFNYLTISYALAPIIAPFIGGYAQHYFGWQGGFSFILCLVFICILLTSFTFTETLKVKKQFSMNHLWRNYSGIARTPLFTIPTLFAGIIYGYTAIFNVTAPFIFQDILHYPAVVYGYIALGAGFAWFAGNTTNRFLFHINANIKLFWALMACTITIITMLVCVWLGYLNFFVAAIPAYLLLYFTGFIFPNMVGHCLSLFPDMAASANAGFFAFGWLTFSIFTGAAACFPLHTLAPIAISFLLINVSTQFIYHVYIKRHCFNPQDIQ